ncbi:hypothetical protein ACHAXN_005297 [Cyclotella atomus]
MRMSISHKTKSSAMSLLSMQLKGIVGILFNLILTSNHVFCQDVLTPFEQRVINQQSKYTSQRRLIYIPPPPITPFRGGLKTVQHEPPANASSSQQSSAPTSAWTPEQYPDPWTNPLACGGAATAPYRDYTIQPQLNSTNATTPRYIPDRDFMHWFDIPALGNDGQIIPDQEGFQQQKKLLFCDPDQLLDVDTLKNVALQLQAFAETFASDTLSLAEGGTFGSDEDASIDSSEDGNADSSEGKVLTGHTSFNVISSINTLLHGKNTRRRQLRGIKTFSNTIDIDRDLEVWEEGSIKEPIEVGIALVKKIDLPAILRADSYFFYSDQVADLSGLVATPEPQIFISTSDKICYISSGTRIATILPWWRLEHVVQDMKPGLRKGQTGEALGIAIDELTQLLQQGPPSFIDRLDDFVERFGVVIAFTIFTFVFATWGECRDRRKRFFSAERMSRMNKSEKEKARRLQKEFQTKACPICLESFDTTNKQLDEDTPPEDPQKKKLKRVDSFGIPLIGTDKLPIKLLRCGHIFDSTCWKIWVDSGQGNPWVCPVCRQDVGRVKRHMANPGTPERTTITENTNRHDGINRQEVDERRVSFARVPPVTPSMLLLPVGHTHPSYSSIQTLVSYGGTPFAPFSHPPLRRLYPRPASSPNVLNDIPTEETPLFAQETLVSEESDDY